MKRRDPDIVMHRSKEALAFIERNELSCCPDVYETVYNFIARDSEDLIKNVNRLIKEDRVSDESILALSQKEEKQAYLARLPAIVDAVVSSIHEMTNGIQDSQDKFASVADKIADKSISSDDLSAIATQLLEASDSYAKQLEIGSGSFADHANEVTQLKEELRQKEKQLETDTLTGVGTRLFMERQFSEMTHNLDRLNHGLSIVVVDVDNFKTLNDNHGHKIGDQVLRFVASNLNKLSEESPYTVTRYGGEEFVLVFNDYALDKVFETVDRLREDLSNKKIKRKDTQQLIGDITASFGVAHISAYEINTKACDVSLEGLIHRADTAMYRAKRTGKNKVMVAPSVSDDIGIDIDDSGVTA